MSKRNPATSQSSGSVKQPTKKIQVPTAEKTKKIKKKTLRKLKNFDKDLCVPYEVGDKVDRLPPTN